MTIYIHEFYKDKEKALALAELPDELDYHRFVHGCEPKKVNIVPYWADCDKYKANKSTMTLFIS
ncbi:hypothetical protein SBF1_50037 [Candidatus Desulfosporosinus infrequens]|uniref:Uncharacterized protein n=1 Tax=Candidatus Desulfosporosinus infrequens TaxID=2043169 RepID=A0A2U3LGX8_9FIRM|nr:hypothetical protein SBF1_50037 [Candidatus Desulfosporosinus infrequens]